MVAQVRPPPSDPANNAFLRVMVWGLIVRSTMLESISIVYRRAEICRASAAALFDDLGT